MRAISTSMQSGSAKGMPSAEAMSSTIQKTSMGRPRLMPAAASTPAYGSFATWKWLSVSVYCEIPFSSPSASF